VGGFFGDEGKGKITSYLSFTDKPSMCVRTGSINAGHTVRFHDRLWRLRMIPSCFVNEFTKLMIAPGALLKVDLLFKEIEETGTQGRVWVDERAGIIEERHVEWERSDEYLMKSIGSTGQGVGAAMVDRVLRRLRLARDTPELASLLIDVPKEVNEELDRGGYVMVEGTQGTFLSLYHGTYPYVTSRDTTASGIASEVGVGPKRISDVILVLKSYVTRVGSGELPGELSPGEAEARGWVERGTVTGRLRRVAPFSLELARRAVLLNSPTQIAITRLDALFPEARGKRRWMDLPVEARRWVEGISDELRVPVTILSTGEDVMDTVDLRREVMGP